MSGPEKLLLFLADILFGAIGIYAFIFPRKLQAWNVNRLKHGWERHITPSFFVRYAESKLVFWQIRIGGLLLLLLVLDTLYDLLR